VQLDGGTVGETICEVYERDVVTRNPVERGELRFKLVDALFNRHKIGIERSNIWDLF
jgi:hypothetical protein